MLPLTLLNAAVGKPMLVELKNGETFNGHLSACDAFMNLVLKEVYQTSAVCPLCPIFAWLHTDPGTLAHCRMERSFGSFQSVIFAARLYVLTSICANTTDARAADQVHAYRRRGDRPGQGA